ncbi:hypothetical protein QAD02_012802 [Eretmocerus hayati]|uniref:Uncharacterized protein n=1 Tax=Eretmocerus hayati TaxID=131215 RepID=A0ACC2P0Q3_9HYME|nr:hypothetical protein QAD02_012802 [Eretmocerus hayati]
MIWSIPPAPEDCYFFVRPVEVNSVERKMAEEVGIATLDLTETQEMEVDEFFEEDVSDDDDEEYLPAGEGEAPELFDQEELNDVVRKLGLPKDGAEYFASLLKKKDLLTKGTKVKFPGQLLGSDLRFECGKNSCQFLAKSNF